MQFQIFIQEPERVGLSSLCTTLQAVLTYTIFSIIMDRLERDRPSIKPVYNFIFKEINCSASSPHVIIVFIMFFMDGTMLYSLALFLPSIISQLEFSPNKTQLLSAGPFAAGFFGEWFVSKRNISIMANSLPLLLVTLVTIISAFLSDHYESRGITTVLISLFSISGFALYLGNIICAWIRYLILGVI